ncbi:hypothetical protein CEW46_23965 [Bacillus cereus]|nr:hypothetical protein CEW46_23965 [Bacillus cereus]
MIKFINESTVYTKGEVELTEASQANNTGWDIVDAIVKLFNGKNKIEHWTEDGEAVHGQKVTPLIKDSAFIVFDIDSGKEAGGATIVANSRSLQGVDVSSKKEKPVAEVMPDGTLYVITAEDGKNRGRQKVANVKDFGTAKIGALVLANLVY